MEMVMTQQRRHTFRTTALALGAAVALAAPMVLSAQTATGRRTDDGAQAQGARGQGAGQGQGQQAQGQGRGQGGGRGGGWREGRIYQAAPGEWTGPRLSDGQPNVQGHWSNTISNHNNLTRAAGGRGGAPTVSLVSDPPDGQVPFQPWARAKAEELAAHLENPIRPEYVEPLARCAPAGPTKSFLWHGYEIRQYPGYLVFFFDSGTRVIKLDGSAHLPAAIRLWNGDSRGRWEGNTLVVDVANANGKSRFGRTGEFVSDKATITERFVFDDGDRERFTYHATYTDTTVLTRPMTITIPNRKVTAESPADGWNNQTFPAVHAGTDVILEVLERTCVENNGNHGEPAVAPPAAASATR
jgi:hypothetical protein